MKKITLIILCLMASFWSYAQCTTSTGDQWPSDVVTAASDNSAAQISSNNWPNAEFSLIDGLTVGNTYTIDGANTVGVYITVVESDATFTLPGGAVIAHGATSVSFTATTAEILVFWHLDSSCGTQTNEDTVTTITCTSCTCPATAAPSTAVADAPANNATGVTIDTSGTNPVISFSWTDSGDATSYDFTLVGVGTVASVGNPVNISYGGWAYDTTYTWTITSYNCFGSTTSSTFTFTTGSDPLSTNDFSLSNDFFHFYNTTTNSLELKSSYSFSNIVVYNLLGQSVLEQELSQTEENVNLNSLTSGTYIAKVNFDGKTQTIKFIKR